MSRAYTNERTVLGLEVEDGRPVVGSVLLEATGRTRRQTSEIVVMVHGNIERILRWVLKVRWLWSFQMLSDILLR